MAYLDSVAEYLLCAGTMIPAAERPVGAKRGALAEEIVPAVMTMDSSNQLKGEQEPLVGGGRGDVSQRRHGFPFLRDGRTETRSGTGGQDQGHSIPEPAFQPGRGRVFEGKLFPALRSSFLRGITGP